MSNHESISCRKRLPQEKNRQFGGLQGWRTEL